MDITCAHCGEPWEVYELRHGGADLMTAKQREELRTVLPKLDHALKRVEAATTEEGTANLRRHAHGAIYEAVLSGKGCPDSACGFVHDGPGQHREQQLYELVFDGVTDDDPMLFMIDL